MTIIRPHQVPPLSPQESVNAPPTTHPQGLAPEVPLDIPDAVFHAAPDGRLLNVSAAMARMLRYASPDQVMGARKSIAQHLSVEPGWWEEMVCIMLANHDALTFETHCWRQDGSLMAAHLHTRIVRAQDGRIRFIKGHIEDITRKRWGQMPHTLTVLEAISDYVVTTDLHGQIQFCNRAARHLLAPGAGEVDGVNEADEAIASANLFDLHPAQVNEHVMCEGMIMAVCHGVWSGETTMLHRDGSEIPVWQVLLSHIASDGKVEGFSMIARDIRGQKRIEAAGQRLRQEIDQRMREYAGHSRAISVGERAEVCSEKWVKAALRAIACAAPVDDPLLERLPAAGYVARYEGEGEGKILHMLSVGPQFETLFGFPPDAWTSQPDFWSHVVCPNDRERVATAYWKGVAHGQPFSLEYRVLARDRRVVWVRDEVVPLPTTSQPRCAYGVMVEVSERKRAEHEVQTLLPILRAARTASSP